MKRYLGVALALAALAGCSSANKSDGRDEAQQQLPVSPGSAVLIHSNVSQFDGQVAIQVKMELVNGNTQVTISPIPSWPVQNAFLGLDHFYYSASCEHPIIEVKDEGCDEMVDDNGQACGWTVNYDGCVADGFGCFISRKSDGPASHGATTQDLVFVLSGDVIFGMNDHQATFAVHGRFSEDCSAWFSDGPATSVQSEPACKPWAPRTCSLSVNPQQLTVVEGSWGTATVNVTEAGGQPPLVPVTLSVAGPPPSGTSIGFVPNPVNPPGASILTVQTVDGAAIGDFPIQILGTGQDALGRFQCTTTLQLKIEEPVPPQTGACICP